MMVRRCQAAHNRDYRRVSSRRCPIGWQSMAATPLDSRHFTLSSDSTAAKNRTATWGHAIERAGTTVNDPFRTFGPIKLARRSAASRAATMSVRARFRGWKDILTEPGLALHIREQQPPW